MALDAELIGEALLDAFDRRDEANRRRAREFVEWLREALEPPDGITLRCDDGSTFTGVIAFDRSRPVAAIVVRHPGARGMPQAPPRPQPTSPMSSSFRYGFPVEELDPDSPEWDRDGDPFRR